MAAITTNIEYTDIEIHADGMIYVRTGDREDVRALWQDETRALYLFFQRPDVREQLRDTVFRRDD